MSTFQVSGRMFVLDGPAVERAVDGVLPGPIREHFVVVGRRRFPPKQVLSLVTGLDRADFTTHQARRILKRLGFAAGRKTERQAPTSETPERRPHGGRQAAALEPFVGKWVALGAPDEVLVAADTLDEVIAWLSTYEQRTSGIFRVPRSEREAQGLAPL